MLLDNRGIKAQRVVGEAGSPPVQHTAKRDSSIWCAEGSLAIRTDSTTTPLQPGDAARIDAGTEYEVHAGISGYVYYLS